MTAKQTKRRKPVRLRVVAPKRAVGAMDSANDVLVAKIGAMPFVRDPKRGEKGGGRCFWSVTAGDYHVDYEQGKAWARLVLPFLELNVGGPLLSWIVVDMIRAGERNGLVLGFIREIGNQLGAALASVGMMPVEPPPPRPRKVWDRDTPAA